MACFIAIALAQSEAERQLLICSREAGERGEEEDGGRQEGEMRKI